MMLAHLRFQVMPRHLFSIKETDGITSRESLPVFSAAIC